MTYFLIAAHSGDILRTFAADSDAEAVGRATEWLNSSAPSYVHTAELELGEWEDEDTYAPERLVTTLYRDEDDDGSFVR